MGKPRCGRCGLRKTLWGSVCPRCGHVWGEVPEAARIHWFINKLAEDRRGLQRAKDVQRNMEHSVTCWRNGIRHLVREIAKSRGDVEASHG